MKAVKKQSKKLAIVCTHPIQYYVPLFQELSKIIDLKVFYTRPIKRNQGYDPGFRRRVVWDLPMLKNYTYVFAGNRILEELAAYDPDHVLLYGWPFRHHLRIIQHFRRKIWFRGDSILTSTTNPILSCLKTLVLRWLFSHVDKAFYVGNRNKLYFLKYGLKENQLLYLPHAVDNLRFNQIDPRKSSVIRKRFNIAQTDTVVLFAGKLNGNKNPLLLLEAFRNINKEHMHLLIAGDGELSSRLEKLIREMQNVHLLPFQNQTTMPSVYHSCDLFCMPSLSETWGLAINEAMAAGKAVLVSNAAGAAMDLVDDSNGAIFKSGDIGDLQAKLQTLMSSKERLVDLGQQGQARIRKWSISRQVAIILKELDKPII